MDTAPLTAGPALLWSKTAQVLWTVALLALLSEWAPGLDHLRWWPEDPWDFAPALFRPSRPVEEPLDLTPVDDEALLALGPTELAAGPGPGDAKAMLPASPEPAAEAPAKPVAKTPLAAPPKARKVGNLTILPIEDQQNAMDRFFTALERVRKKEPGAMVRIVHYGDSVITGDYVTGTVRRLLQKKFGDGGPGFVMAGHPAPWYRRENVRLTEGGKWSIQRFTHAAARDGAYGLGGASFKASGGGSWVRYGLTGQDGIGDQISKVQVFYLAQPKGGTFKLKMDDRELLVPTLADKPVSRVAEIQMNEGKHNLEIKTTGPGEVRLFGAVLERSGPGVVYDGLGTDGARAKLLRNMNSAHWHEQLRLRQPDLLILHYGTNESQFVGMSSQAYEADLTQVVGHLRQALPGVSCLLVGPMDRVEKDRNGKLVSRPIIKRIVEVQRKVSAAQGCAYWNTREAMGGDGSMGRWYKVGLAGGDLTHPTRAGADRIGAMFFAALMDGYERFLAQGR